MKALLATIAGLLLAILFVLVGLTQSMSEANDTRDYNQWVQHAQEQAGCPRSNSAVCGFVPQ